jgi:hypothetical protein
VAHLSGPCSTVRYDVDTKNHSLHRCHKPYRHGRFPFYPLRRLKLFISVRVSWIFTFVQNFHHFVHSFDIGKINGMDHAILDWFTAGNLPPSRFTDMFNLSSTSQLLLVFSPSLGDHFSIFSDTSRAPNSSSPPFVDAVALRLPTFIRRR